MECEGKNLAIAPTGEFKSEKEIGGVIVGASQNGSPVYLRDLVEINRSYDSPPRFMNFYTWRDEQGDWQRSRAITLAIQMRPGEQIGKFGEAIDEALEIVKQRLPEDLISARTSDQPLQVAENIDLFMSSLYEAVILVVLTALIGFWEWRSAVLISPSIPLTLAMTFGMMSVLGIDLQQVSIASLIIALGLLVDDPVVAGDAIKRDLAIEHKPIIAAWLGPTNFVLIACGTRPAHNPQIPLCGRRRHRFSFAGGVVDEAGTTCGLLHVRRCGQGHPGAFSDGIYIIPEISMIGKTEQELTAAKIPYEVGIAKYEELTKAQMLGDETGLLKILFDPQSLKVLGVHIIGERTAEIIHIGQVVMSLGRTIEYFRDTVFNYPTMAEAYKVAALDGLNKL